MSATEPGPDETLANVAGAMDHDLEEVRAQPTEALTQARRALEVAEDAQRRAGRHEPSAHDKPRSRDGEDEAADTPARTRSSSAPLATCSGPADPRRRRTTATAATGRRRDRGARAASTGARRRRGTLPSMSFLLRIIASAVAIWVAAAIVPGVDIGGAELTDQALVAVLVGLIFGLVNAVIKPIVTVLAFPLFVLTLGLFTLVVNALLFWLTAWLSGLVDLDFTVDGFLAALLGAIVVSLVSWGLSLVARD